MVSDDEWTPVQVVLYRDIDLLLTIFLQWRPACRRLSLWHKLWYILLCWSLLLCLLEWHRGISLGATLSPWHACILLTSPSVANKVFIIWLLLLGWLYLAWIKDWHLEIIFFGAAFNSFLINIHLLRGKCRSLWWPKLRSLSSDLLRSNAELSWLVLYRRYHVLKLYWEFKARHFLPEILSLAKPGDGFSTKLMFGDSRFTFSLPRVHGFRHWSFISDHGGTEKLDIWSRNLCLHHLSEPTLAWFDWETCLLYSPFAEASTVKLWLA